MLEKLIAEIRADIAELKAKLVEAEQAKRRMLAVLTAPAGKFQTKKEWLS